MQPGRLITFEGGEGSGKTTQINLLMAAFEKAGVEVVSTREPGGTPDAEQIRDLLVRGDGRKWDDVSELLLFYAARQEHVARFIKPALQAGRHVICDRFSDSSRIYQGFGKRLGDGYVQQLHRLVMGNFAPDLTVWLDMDAGKGLDRSRARQAGDGETRFESLSLDFHERVRMGFEWLASNEPGRLAKISGQQTVDTVHAEVIATVNRRLGMNLRVQES